MCEKRYQQGARSDRKDEQVTLIARLKSHDDLVYKSGRGKHQTYDLFTVALSHSHVHTVFCKLPN